MVAARNGRLHTYLGAFLHMTVLQYTPSIIRPEGAGLMHIHLKQKPSNHTKLGLGCCIGACSFSIKKRIFPFCELII